jgi:hypothetical protein
MTEALTGTGKLYSSFFDIKPPGLYLLLAMIQGIVGTSYAAWVFIYFILCVALSFLILALVCILFNGRIQNVVLGIVLITQSISISYSANFLSADFIGLILSLSGLYGLMRLRNSIYLPIFIVLLIFAGTIKEVYIFVPLVIIAFLSKLSLPRIFLTLLFCTLFVYILILVTLVTFGEFQSYTEVFNFKSDQFGFANMQDFILRSLRIGFEIVTVPSITFLLSITIALMLREWKSTSRISTLELNTNLKLIILFVTFVYFGLVWQGKAVKGHTLIAIYIPLILLLLSLIFKMINIGRYGKNAVLQIYLLIAMLLISLLSCSNSQFLELRNFNLVDYGKSVLQEKGASKFQIPGNGCLLSVYGWDAGAYYHYSKRDPCTRFFLSPLIDRSPTLWKLYRNEIYANPPRTVVYLTDGADIDVARFEMKVLDWKRILAGCYQGDQEGVYVPKAENILPHILQSCLKKFSKV